MSSKRGSAVRATSCRRADRPRRRGLANGLWFLRCGLFRCCRKRDNFVFQSGSPRKQARQLRLPVIKQKGRAVQCPRKPSCRFDQRYTGSHIPFMLRSQGPGSVSQSRRHTGQLIGDRTRGTDFKTLSLKLFPLAALHFAAACEYHATFEVRSRTGSRPLPVEEQTALHCPHKNFLCGRIANAAREGLAVSRQANRATPLRNSLHKFPRAIERVDDPNPTAL